MRLRFYLAKIYEYENTDTDAIKDKALIEKIFGKNIQLKFVC